MSTPLPTAAPAAAAPVQPTAAASNPSEETNENPPVENSAAAAAAAAAAVVVDNVVVGGPSVAAIADNTMASGNDGSSGDAIAGTAASVPVKAESATEGQQAQELPMGAPPDMETGTSGATSENVLQSKRKERLEQNRISARESRKRKKSMIEELQRTVIALTSENKELNGRNQSLRSNLSEIGRKVRSTSRWCWQQMQRMCIVMCGFVSNSRCVQSCFAL